MDRNKCYGCVYSRPIPGNAHLSCHHPDTRPIWGNPLADLMSLMGGRAGNIDLTGSIKGITVRGDEHGKKCGWFNWPTNFDPTWLIECSGFKSKGEGNEGQE